MEDSIKLSDFDNFYSEVVMAGLHCCRKQINKKLTYKFHVKENVVFFLVYDDNEVVKSFTELSPAIEYYNNV